MLQSSLIPAHSGGMCQITVPVKLDLKIVTLVEENKICENVKCLFKMPYGLPAKETDRISDCALH